MQNNFIRPNLKNLRCELTIFALTFSIFLPILLVHTPHSLYFIKWGSEITTDGLKKQNFFRVHNAETQLQALKQLKSHLPNYHEFESDGIRVAIAVVSVSRNRHELDSFEPKYLTQTAIRLHELNKAFEESQLISQNKTTFDIRICNVDSHVRTFVEANNLSSVFQQFVRFPTKDHFSFVHTLEKEKQDYLFCLNESLKLHPSHVMIVEDDAFPLQNLFPVVDHVLRQRVDTSHLKYQRLAFVKLFHPERLLKYTMPDEWLVLELVGFGLLFGSIAFQLQRLLVPTSAARERHWISWIVYFIGLCFAIGHPNVVQFRSIFAPYLYALRPSPSCCTPALLFPADEARKIVQFMSTKQCSNNYAKDSVLDEYVRDSNATALYVEPNLFQHIGQLSALRSQYVDPLLV